MPELEAVNARVYQDVNNGAYRAGFSSNQAVHEEAARKYFEAFDWLNSRLATRRYLLSTPTVGGADHSDPPGGAEKGTTVTEADLRLFPTIFRHDAVYHARMKLNVAMVRDYPHLNRWFLDMLAVDGVAAASNLAHCVAGYFGRTGNGICPFVGLEHDGKRPY